MKFFKKYVKQWFYYLFNFIKASILNNAAKDLEIVALKSQIAILTEQLENKKIKKPKSSIAFRQLWILVSKLHPNWKPIMAVYNPDTIIKWRNQKYKLHWRTISKPIGRPTINKEAIAIIKAIHKENPLLSPEKIHEMLVSLGIIDALAPNTIAKYLPSTRKPPSEKQKQSWKTFLKNHSKDIWAMDYFVVPTIRFKLLYVLIIINHGSRKIEHFAVTEHPNLYWLKQQIRNATPFGHIPKYLIHDNDSVFVCKDFQLFLSKLGIKSKSTAYHAPWQNGIAERVNGIIRQELTNHIIPFNKKHLTNLLSDYINNYYNTHRTHQGINGKTPIPLPEYLPTKLEDSKFIKTSVLNGLYHTYDKVA